MVFIQFLVRLFRYKAKPKFLDLPIEDRLVAAYLSRTNNRVFNDDKSR